MPRLGIVALAVFGAAVGCRAPESEEGPGRSLLDWVSVDSGGRGAGAPAGPDASPGAPGGDGSADAGELELHGSLSTRLRHRSGDGENDTDLFSRLSLQINDPDRDAYSGYILGRMSYDLGGREAGDDVFFGLDDTDSSSPDGRLYEAYVDFNAVEGLSTLRVGRQTTLATPEVLSFDGVLAVTEPDPDTGISWAGYAGVPYHVYESSHSGDELAGAWVEARPWDGGRVRMDFLHAEDELTYGDEKLDVLGLGVWHTFPRRLSLQGGYSRMDGRDRDLELAATWSEPDEDLVVSFRYDEQLSTIRRQVTEADPFYESLVEYDPYRHQRLLVSKGFGRHWSLQTGVESREVDGDDEDAYNNSFARYHITTTADDVVAEDVTVAVTGELWDEDAGNDFTTWGLDVTKELHEDTRVSAGFAYALWKSDVLLEGDREDVYTYYVRLRRRLTEATTWSLGYALEDNDLDHFHTVTARLTWRF